MHPLKAAVLPLLLFAASPAGAGDRLACTEADLAHTTQVFEGRVVSLRHQVKWTTASLVVTKVLQGEVGKRVRVHINIPRRRELTLTRGARYRLHATASGQDTPWVLCGQRLTGRGKAG